MLKEVLKKATLTFRRNVINSVGLVGLVLPCHHAFMGPKYFLLVILWVRNFFPWVFRGSKIFSRGYFVDLKLFFVGISWVPIFFSRVFPRSQTFSRGYFVGLKFFLVGISWVQDFMTFNKLQ